MLLPRRKRSISNTRPAEVRLIAQRSCVACRQVKGKRDLVRLVRTPEGGIEIDSTGRKTGRGAYLCPSRECWEAALQGNRLEHSLRASLSRENRQQLEEQGEALLKGDNQW